MTHPLGEDLISPQSHGDTEPSSRFACYGGQVDDDQDNDRDNDERRARMRCHFDKEQRQR